MRFLTVMKSTLMASKQASRSRTLEIDLQLATFVTISSLAEAVTENRKTAHKDSLFI